MPIVQQYDTEDAIPEGIRSQLGAAVDSEWPRLEASEPLVDALFHPTHFVLLQDLTLLSYGRTIWTHGSCSGSRLKVYGLGDIITPVTLRRRGYGSAIVAASTAHVRADATADAAILHTQPSLDSLYRLGGWMSVNPFSVVTDESREEMAPYLMAVLLSDRAQQLLGGSSGGVLTLPGDEW
jgi:predicted GNAT family N-acyltransferase